MHFVDAVAAEADLKLRDARAKRILVDGEKKVRVRIGSPKEETDMAELKKGDRAPAFELEDQNGRRVKLADFKGRKLLVYFYPKADTPG
jgi:cytochrome oxidase Cu insertion factor (SCO1/SenC/PrrC family)